MKGEQFIATVAVMAKPRSLLARVRANLQRYKRDIPDIAVATGLGVSWMQKVADGRIPDPGIQRIEKLDAHFRERRLQRRSDLVPASFNRHQAQFGQ